MSSVPTHHQLHWQRNHALAMFCHFGINTFYGREWSDGTLDAKAFNPAELDCRQWARIARDAGMAHIILTAKHHDGFCLWPTATKAYSVANTPWKDGKGDVVQELADACREFGVGVGLYLSPWDRSDPDWHQNPESYDARYIEQLTELCTNYGPLVELWFDGAGSEHHDYDWPGIVSVIHEHQPNAMIFNMGDPTIRWIGNEDGLAADPCWYSVDAVDASMYEDAKVGLAGGERYCPPECDVSIRRHWFWQPDDIDTLKSVNHLMAIWYRSIGLGANLLLNVPPGSRGLIDAETEARLLAFAEAVRRRFAHPIRAHVEKRAETFFITFREPVTIDHLILQERLEEGQRITAHSVALPDGTVIVDGVQTVGVQRVHVFPAVTTDSLVVTCEGHGCDLAAAIGYRTGFEEVPSLEDQASFDSTKLQ